MPLVDPLIVKLGAIGNLEDADRALLGTLPVVPKRLAPQESVMRQGDKPHHSVILLSGVLARFQELVEGNRQVVSFHFPGEMPDLHSIYIGEMDHSLVAINEAVVGLVPHEDLHRVVRASASLTALLWKETLIDGAIFRQWITNNGRRGALAGTAHLLCEMMVRAKSIGHLTPEGTWRMPFTQQQLGDALGLSLVHINRTLKALREANVATIERGQLRVLNWDELKRIAGFDPVYLHLNEPLSV